MIHYPKLISLFGPLRYLNTDQFESAHRNFKEQLINSSNHKDVIKTMFTGALYKYSYIFSDENIQEDLITSSRLNLAIESSILRSIESTYSGLIINLAKCKFYGFLYKIGFFVFINVSETKSTFGHITHIFEVRNQYIIRVSLKKFVYLPNFHAFKMIDTPKSSFIFIEISDVWNEPMEPYELDGDLYICPPYKLFK